MVKTALRNALLFAAIAGLNFSLFAKELSQYRLGDKLEADLLADEQITVINPEATALLRDAEAEKTPVVCRLYPAVADQAVADFHAAFERARSSFLNSIEDRFKQKLLDSNAVNSAEFRQLVGEFQRRNKSFPLNADLAARWGTGRGDAGLEAILAARLKEAMKRPIRPRAAPGAMKLTYTIRTISLADTNVTVTPEMVERDGRNMARTNLITLAWAKNKFEDQFSESEQAWGKFTAGFMREFCFPDEPLTRELRDSRTAHLQVADTYAGGQVIAAAGETVDARILAAIHRLSALQKDKAVQQTLAVTRAETAVANERNRWLIAAACGGALLAGVAWFWTRRTRRILLPATVRQAQAGSTDLRAEVAPHLARLMSGKLFQRLLSQREQMINTQNAAAAEMAELEAQLEKVRAPLEERLRAYEQRITELEKELNARGEENEALLKAKIAMVKKQLESARGKNRVELN